MWSLTLVGRISHSSDRIKDVSSDPSPFRQASLHDRLHSVSGCRASHRNGPRGLTSGLSPLGSGSLLSRSSTRNLYTDLIVDSSILQVELTNLRIVGKKSPEKSVHLGHIDGIKCCGRSCV